MLKKAIRRVGRTVLKWLQDDKNASYNLHNSRWPEFSYEWLNYVLFPSILGKEQAVLRPRYTWGVLHGVNLAKALGIKRVSIIEFGVAGGNGLISLEKIVEKIEPIYDVNIDIYGFDTGKGLPKPHDYRDLPNIYTEGGYRMDISKLRQSLKRSKLFLGLVKDTVPDFIQTEPAPIAFISFDLDLYSSTMHALQIFDADQHLLLPRIHCYFDDIMGFTCGDHNGERLAISDFNTSHKMRKISPIYGLRYRLPMPYAHSAWMEMFFMAHIFDHYQYKCFDGLVPLQELSLAEE